MKGRVTVAKVKTGIPVLDTALPRGIPRNNMVMIVGEGGTGKSVFILQLMYERLKRGEPCIFMCFDDAPIAIEQNAMAFGWDLSKYADEDLLRFIDCFSFRMKPDKTKIPKHVTYVENPRDLHQLTQIFITSMDRMGIVGKGAVFIDSLTELLSITESAIALETIKTWRAEAAKERLATVFGTFHFGIKPFDDFEQILEYVVDGIIDLRYDPVLMHQGILVKQFRIRKMKGAPHETKWFTFKVTDNGIEQLKVEMPHSPSQ
ncbi:MAG: RAD55 family ATPase [archaeon GB-1867-005]|nr:RAD55 family ATPase [Candidatus Culexmicrobium cathedralense]